MNAPTLLIGLGGTGCKIIERVSKMVTGEQRNNIAFAVFDTDINDLRGIQERNPFIKTIQTSTKQTVGEYLNKDTHARDTWFPVNAILNGKTLTEGAGQVRSISRLALETVIRAGKMEPLHEAIQSLYKVEEDKADQALRVVIVSSLAGGTGSGLILPVALYTRNYLQTHFRQSANITRGFFILPEVFYEVITGQTERNNLKANAYATLRELDAFLMKGDATLHERYANSVRMQFPRAASNGYEEYDVRPYDFCFLFDAQNAEGGKLNSFDQYLDHAANCIYAQSIGPMNKRSNSSEDNTIRKLAKERGRNRYAGAGASMLVYPFEDIRTLIALKWTKQCVSKQWMVFDDLYKELCKENDQKREQGLSAKEQSLSAFYANQVESAAKHDDAFAKAIIKSTGKYTNGVTRTSDRWKEYEDGSCYWGYFSSIVVHPKYRHHGIATQMLLYWSEFVLRLANSRSIYFKGIVADAVSDIGAYLLSKIGFSFVRQSTHKTRIMTLNLFSEDVQRSMFNEKILTVYREYGERNGKCHAI